MRLPDFFIIGAMKAATSTLHDQLAAQPGLWMSEPKELYFFSDDPVWEQGLPWYADHFSGAKPTDICGESTTHYAKLPTYPNTIDRLKSTVTDPRFIYIMRDPVDRLVSQYQHMTLEREISVSFEEAIAGTVPELVDYSCYARQLRPFIEAFGHQSILPVFFDHMLRSPQVELERVCDFLGYSGEPRWQPKTESNITSERLAVSSTRDRIKTLPLFDTARKLVPDQLIERIRDRWRVGPAPELSGDDLRRVRARIDNDLQELGSWLGLTLTCENFRSVTRDAPHSWVPELDQLVTPANVSVQSAEPGNPSLDTSGISGSSVEHD